MLRFIGWGQRCQSHCPGKGLPQCLGSASQNKAVLAAKLLTDLDQVLQGPFPNSETSATAAVKSRSLQRWPAAMVVRL